MFWSGFWKLFFRWLCADVMKAEAENNGQGTRLLRRGDELTPSNSIIKTPDKNVFWLQSCTAMFSRSLQGWNRSSKIFPQLMGWELCRSRTMMVTAPDSHYFNPHQTQGSPPHRVLEEPPPIRTERFHHRIKEVMIPPPPPHRGTAFRSFIEMMTQDPHGWI